MVQFRTVDAGIQFESQQQDVGIEINPKHDDDECSDGTVDGIIPAEIIDKKSKADGGGYREQGGKGRARRDESPATFYCRTVIVQERDCQEDHSQDNQPSAALQ